MGSAGLVDALFFDHDAVGAATTPLRVDWSDASAFAADADRWLVGHRDFGDHEADRWVESGELDTGGFADRAAAAVAADQIRGVE